MLVHGAAMEQCTSHSRPRKAPADAGSMDAAQWPDEALQPLLYSLTNDGSVRVRRKAMAALESAQVRNKSRISQRLIKARI